MKILVTTFYYPNYQELAKLTVDDNLAWYCFRLKYHFKPFAIDEEIDPDPYKMACKACRKNTELLLKLLEDNPELEYVWHRDCDSVITNMNRRLEDIITEYPYDIVTGSDKAGISMGQVLIKNTDRAKLYLREILEGIDHKGYEHEQKYMWANPRPFVFPTPQRVMNSYDCESRLEPLDDPSNWQPGDFLVHMAGMNLKQKMERVEMWMARMDFNG